MVRWDLILCAVASAAFVCSGPVNARGTDDVAAYQIPAMDLKKAIVALARQSGLSISFNGAQLDGLRSNYVVSALSDFDALEKILARSPYTFQLVGDRTVILKPRELKENESVAPAAAREVQAQPYFDSIIVTATKRDALVSKLPLSVSALDSDDLSASGARVITDLAPRLAGVATTNLGAGRNKIFLRGASDGAFADRTQSTVGVYLDETRLILNDTNPDLRLTDIERIEVVRGPQVALYGDGSVGGIFRAVTRKPDLGAYAGGLRTSLSATKQGGPNAELDATLNLPLVRDRAGLRIVGYYERASGYIDDLGLAQEDVNRSNLFGGRIAGRYKAADDWTLDAIAVFQQTNLGAPQYTFPDLGALRRSTRRLEPHRDQFELYSVTANGAVGGVSVMSSSSYVHRDIDDTNDASASLPIILGDPSAEGVFETSQDVKAFTHESRAASATGGTIDWLGGVFLSLRNEDLSSRLIADYLASASIAFLGDRHDESNEAAVFGEITVRPDARLAITAGARLSRIGFGIDAVASGVANSGAPSLVEKRSRIAVAPRVAVSLDASPALFVYAQAAAGSRIGGFNINTPLEAITLLNPNDDVTRFESDTLWNAEIGAKFRLFDNRAKVNISAFYLQWREIQTDQILPTGFTFVGNAGDARNFGVEIEATARPSPRLEISGAFFWNDPQLTEANPFLNAEKGDLLPNIAEMTASFGATYEVQLTGGWSASANATYSYVGTSVLTFAEDVAPTMGDYHLAGVGLKAERDGLRIGVFADNLFDSRGDTFAFGNSFSLATRDQSTPLRPRTLGVYVESSF